MSRFPRRGRAPFDGAGKRGLHRALLFIVLVVAFLITPLVLARSIIFLDPAQGAMLLGGFAVAVLLALPLRRKNINPAFLAGGLALYVGFDVMWADYVAIDIPFLPYLTPVKLFLLGLEGTWIFLAATTRNIHDRIWEALKALPVLTLALLTVFTFELMAVPFSIAPSLSSRDMFNDAVFYYLPFFIAATTIRTRGQVHAVLKTLVICAGLVGIIVVAESILRQNLYVKVFGKWINYDAAWLQRIFAGAERAGKYRALGPFVNYLSLGDYVVLCVPFVVYYFERAKSAWKRIALAVIALLCVYATIAADSRTAELSMMLVGGAYAVIKCSRYLANHKDSPWRPALVLVLVVGLVVGPLVFFEAFRKMNAYTNSAFGGTGSRTEMLMIGLPKIKARPIIGYGPGAAAEALGWKADGSDLTIDSYYLSMVLDAGIPGLIGFLMLPLTIMYVGYRRWRRGSPDAPLFLAFSLSAFGFALVRATTSQYENINYFHILLGTFVALLMILKEEKDASALAVSPEAVPALATAPRRRRRRRVGETSIFARSTPPA